MDASEVFVKYAFVIFKSFVAYSNTFSICLDFILRCYTISYPSLLLIFIQEERKAAKLKEIDDIFDEEDEEEDEEEQMDVDNQSDNDE